MRYTYATLLLAESDAEINESNLVAVLKAAGTEADRSRVKATIAALEGVDLDRTDLTPAAGPDPGEDAPVEVTTDTGERASADAEVPE